MNKKKLIFSVLLVVLVGFVSYLYDAFNGNPVTNYFSKKALENYLEETYPEKTFRVNDGYYNFKYSQYEFDVIEIGSTTKDGNVKEYSFRMQGVFFPEVSWDGIYYDNLDEALATRLSREAEGEIAPLLRDQVDLIHHVGVHLEVLKGVLAEDVKWNKELSLEKPMEIFIQLNATDQSKDDFVASAKKIKEILDEQGYTYASILYNASGFDMEGVKAETHGYLKYSLRVDQDEAVTSKDVELHNKGMW